MEGNWCSFVCGEFACCLTRRGLTHRSQLPQNKHFKMDISHRRDQPEKRFYRGLPKVIIW